LQQVVEFLRELSADAGRLALIDQLHHAVQVCAHPPQLPVSLKIDCRKRATHPMTKAEITEKESACHVVGDRPVNDDRFFFAIDRHVDPLRAALRFVQLRTPAATATRSLFNFLLLPALVHFDSPRLSYS
jgi:hypothetical protein